MTVLQKRSGPANIGPRGRRRRLAMGMIGLGTGVLGAAALVAAGVSPGWRALLLVPFTVGALGVVQARTGT